MPTACAREPRCASGVLYVIATSPEEADVALTAPPARHPQPSSVVILVPHVVPFGAPLDRCGCDLHTIGSRFRTCAARTAIPVSVRVCVCRDPRHIVGRLLLDRARVVVAGRRGRWFRSRAERLAETLVRDGHDAAFADCAAARTGV